MKALLLIVMVIVSTSLFAQEDFSKHQSFFDRNFIEYQKWLQLDKKTRFLSCDSVIASVDRVRIYLSAKPSGRDSNFVNEVKLCKELFEKFLFVSDLEPVDLEMFVSFKKQMTFIFFAPKNDFRLSYIEGTNIESAKRKLLEYNTTLSPTLILDALGKFASKRYESDIDDGIIVIEYSKLKPGFLSKNSMMPVTEKSVRKITQQIKDFIYNFYKNKGTTWIWNARIDTSDFYYNEFIYKISHMSGVVLEEDFFEFHQIHVKVEIDHPRGIVIRWDMQGKYGSGTTFPPLENDYKDMESNPKYRDILRRYEKKMLRKIEMMLRN